MHFSFLHILFLLFVLLFNNSFAQSDLNLDSIHTIKHSTYQYQNNQKELSIIKESVYDTNQILLTQNRYHYSKVDTGFAITTHYNLSYNPKNKHGAYYTEQLAHPSKPNKKPSKQLAEFKSYDHKYKREWVKLYKKNSKSLKRKTTQTYDENGYSTSTETINYDIEPNTSSTEKVERNAAGNIVFWESFDQDGNLNLQARSFEAKYKNDTLLLYSGGYLYHNWNETKNKYDKNNQLKKSTNYIGTRGSNGKVKRNDEITTLYKNNLPYQCVEKKLKKTIKTTLFLYQQDSLSPLGITDLEIQQITTPESTYKEIKTFTYQDSAKKFLRHYTETLNGKPFVKKEFEYDTASSQLIKYTEVEYRTNGKDWKTVKEYNLRGNLTRIRFFMDNELSKEDIYEYTYQIPTIKEE